MSHGINRGFCFAIVLVLLGTSHYLAGQAKTHELKGPDDPEKTEVQSAEPLQLLELSVGDEEKLVRASYPGLFVQKAWEKEGEQSYISSFSAKSGVRDVIIATKQGKMSFWAVAGPSKETASNTEEFISSLTIHALWIQKKYGKPSHVSVRKLSDAAEEDYIVLQWGENLSKIDFIFTAPWSIGHKKVGGRFFHLVAYSDESAFREGFSGASFQVLTDDENKRKKALDFLDEIAMAKVAHSEGFLVPKEILRPDKEK